MAKIYSQLIKAQLENVSGDLSSTATGIVWFDTSATKAKIYDGSNIRSLLRNDQYCVIGNDGTANNNVRFNRAGSGKLQIVLGGDSTAEGSSSTNIAEISMVLESYTDAGKPSAGVAGRPIYLTDLQKVQYDNGASWVDLASSGSAISVVAKTSDYTILTSEAQGNRLFTNEGASGDVKLTLPTAVAGQVVTIACAENYKIEVEAASGDKIYTNNATNVDIIFNNIKGNIVQLYAINATEWLAIDEENWNQGGGRGLTFGGNTGSNSSKIEYFDTANTGNAAQFGNLSTARYGGSCNSSATRAVCNGGSDTGIINDIKYVEISALSDDYDFGNLLAARYICGSCSSATLGVTIGGYTGAAYSDVLDKITIATTNDATSFGTLATASGGICGMGDSTRGVFTGGDQNNTKIIYITYTTPGGGTNFGDAATATHYRAACSNSTRGIIGGGASFNNQIEYITIQSTGNGTSFGTLATGGRATPSACASEINGFFMGGDKTPGGAYTNEISYIQFDTLGNTNDWGDLTESKSSLGGCSNVHGGL